MAAEDQPEPGEAGQARQEESQQAQALAAAGQGADRDVMGGLDDLPRPAAGEGGVISDAVADRLFQTLDLLEADYNRTVAAGASRHHQAAEQDAAAAAAAANSVEEAAADDDDDGPVAPAGYAALGSDDDGSEDDVEGWLGDQPDRPEEGAEAPAGVAGEDPATGLGQATPAWPGAGGSGDEAAEGSPTADGSEGFANFGASNPAMPPPPPFKSQLQSTVLSDTDVSLIKSAMGQLNLKPPPWAQQISERDLQRMIKKAVDEDK